MEVMKMIFYAIIIKGNSQSIRSSNVQVLFFRCDFERDECLWDVSVDSPLFWQRYRADVLPYQQRPPYDHTTRSQRVS